MFENEYFIPETNSLDDLPGADSDFGLRFSDVAADAMESAAQETLFFKGAAAIAIPTIEALSESPVLSRDEVRSRQQKDGILFDVPESGMREDTYAFYKDRQALKKKNADVLAQASSGLATQAGIFGASIGVGFFDPINYALPGLGLSSQSARVAAFGGTSAFARGAARFGAGALEGAAQNALLEPVNYLLTKEVLNEDYDFTDALVNLTVGGVVGGGLHAFAGGAADARIAAKLQAFDGPDGRFDAEGFYSFLNKNSPADLNRLPDVDSFGELIQALPVARRSELLDIATRQMMMDGRIDMGPVLAREMNAIAGDIGPVVPTDSFFEAPEIARIYNRIPEAREGFSAAALADQSFPDRASAVAYVRSAGIDPAGVVYTRDAAGGYKPTEIMAGSARRDEAGNILRFDSPEKAAMHTGENGVVVQVEGTYGIFDAAAASKPAAMKAAAEGRLQLYEKGLKQDIPSAQVSSATVAAEPSIALPPKDFEGDAAFDRAAEARETVESLAGVREGKDLPDAVRKALDEGSAKVEQARRTSDALLDYARCLTGAAA